MKFGLLRVTEPGGQPHDLPLDLPSLTIGRSGDNPIVLNDTSVELRHARLVFESGRLLIEDLASRSGTFVGGQRIQPHAPHLVEPGQQLRVGNVELSFFEPPPVGDASPGQAGGVARPLPAGGPGAAAGAAGPPIRVALTVPPQSGTVNAGDTLQATVSVLNRGRVVDQVVVSIADLPAGWVSIPSPAVSLVPGAREDVLVIIRPPRSPEAVAKQYAFTARAVSAGQGQFASEPASFAIAAFESVSARLQPATGSGVRKLIITNSGNAPVTYAVQGRDDEDVIDYRIDDPTIEVPPGTEREVKLNPKKPGRKLVGQPSTTAFKVMAAPIGRAGTNLEVDGQVVQSPPIRSLRMPLALLGLAGLAALVAGAACMFFPRGDDDTAPPATPVVEPTSVPENPEARYDGVHMCSPDGGKQSERRSDVDLPMARPAGAGFGPFDDVAFAAGPLFAQNDPQWARVEYAKAKDPQFPDWCGSTIEQCGCAMTSVATIMALFQLVAMPDGSELNPQSMNAWYNEDARKTANGWVSRGYVYGDVVWAAANALSAEMTRAGVGKGTIRFARFGSGSEEEIRSELLAGRPVVLAVPGHYIAAYKLEGDRILINDPYYKERTTLDVYRGKVKQSVLFEPSNDLSAIVITVASDLRVRVTDDKGRVVGTLNPGSPEAARRGAQAGISGSMYSFDEAWRDPTCVEKAPKPGQGTNQIIIPNPAPGGYKIEVINPSGGGTSVAIHTIDREGKISVKTEDKSGGQTIGLTVNDQAQSAATPEATPTPTAVVKATNTPVPPTRIPPTVTPRPTDTPAPTDTPQPTTAAATATPTAGPQPPQAVTLNCGYDAPLPTKATFTCTARITGKYDTTKWEINGDPYPQFANQTTFTLVFSAASKFQLRFSACNQGACNVQTQDWVITMPPKLNSTTDILSEPPSYNNHCPFANIQFFVYVGPSSPVYPTGTVELYDGSTRIDTGTLDGVGFATMSDDRKTKTIGNHNYTVRYLGDGNFNPSTSQRYTFTISNANCNTIG